VEWLGEIPEGWDVRRLKHISTTNFSNVNKHTVEGERPVQLCNYVDVYNNEFITPKIDFMKATAPDSQIAKFKLKKGDVLITKDSESWDDIAVPAYVRYDFEDVICGYHLAQIHPFPDNCIGNFLFRAFSAHGINDQFRVAATGITRYGLGKYWLDNSLFPLPPLPEQRAIASFLDQETSRIDRFVALKEKQIELLKKKRSAFISHAVTKGLDPNVKMKDSGIAWLGEIPEHWDVERVKTVYNEVNDRSDSGEEELLTVSHISGVTPRSEKEVNMFMAETLEGYKKCEPGDLIINTMWAWMGALGTTDCAGIVSPSYNVYRFWQSKCNPKYYNLLFKTGQFIAEITRFSKGVWSSRLRLYPSEFFEIKIPIPPQIEQENIVKFIITQTGHFERFRFKIEKSISLLKEYRSSLISAAVTGKIDIRGNESILENSAPTITG